MNPKSIIRTRFAPSPTGFVHIGSLRTALFSFLFARHHKGAHVLRVEDTDQSRKVEGSIENLLRVMQTMKIEFDEGFYLKDDGKVGERGEHGPYLQSERLSYYHKYANQLLGSKKAYYCFCSEERLEELRKEQIALKKPPMYDRLCRNLSPEEIEKRMEEFKSQNKNPVVRFAMPLEGTTEIHDLVYGKIIYDNKLLDDQVILKSDGFPTYHLAVVVDDHYMKITHVIRGEEWIPSTPKHLLIYQALGWEPTLFAHLPLITNPDKTKLSKRQGDVSVEDFLNKGFLPEALLNFVAFLGWNPKTEKEIFSLDELISEFEISHINKSSAVLDLNKLEWLNGHYIREMDSKALTEKLIPFWEHDGVEIKKYEMEYLEAIANLEKDRLKKLSEIGERTKYFFQTPEYESKLLIWKKRSGAESASGGSDTTKTRQALKDLAILFENLEESNLNIQTLEENIKQMISNKGYDNGSVLWPLRVALTGMEKSPGPFEVANILSLGLGKEEIIKRIDKAIEKLV